MIDQIEECQKIVSKFTCSLFCFKKIMNMSFHVEMLNRYITETEEMLGDEWRFQQGNNSLKHTSRFVTSFLVKNVLNVI